MGLFSRKVPPTAEERYYGDPAQHEARLAEQERIQGIARERFGAGSAVDMDHWRGVQESQDRHRRDWVAVREWEQSRAGRREARRARKGQ